MSKIKEIIDQVKSDPRKLYAIIGIISVLILYIIFKPSYEHTDNAYVNSNKIMIMPKVAGYITKINFKDNSIVKAGDVIFEIDKFDYQKKLELAESAVKSAESRVSFLKSKHSSEIKQIEDLKARVNSAAAKLDLSDKDLQRKKGLRKDGTISEQLLDISNEQYKSAVSGLESAKASLESGTIQLEGALSQISDAEESEKSAKLQYDIAKDALENTEVKAKFDGIFTNKLVNVGSYIAPGIALGFLFDNSNFWIEANFKETQIAKMKEGSYVEIKLDAIKGKKFNGYVDSLSPASGADFSILPPENATGNFTKIVRRIAVKIKFNDKEDISLVKSGMSVLVDVKVN